MPDLDELRRALVEMERYSGDTAKVQRVVHERMRPSSSDRRGWLVPATAALAVMAVAFGVMRFAGGHSTSPAPAAAASLTPSPATSVATSQPSIGPVYASPPSATTTGSLRCVVPESGTGHQPKISRTAPPVTIDTNPTAVTVVWWDGLNQPKPCRTRIAHGDAAQAHQLAADIRGAAPSDYTTRTNCPADDGTGVQLFFTYAAERSEVVSVKLNGCRAVMAPLRAPLGVTASLLHALAPLRPSS